MLLGGRVEACLRMMSTDIPRVALGIVHLEGFLNSIGKLTLRREEPKAKIKKRSPDRPTAAPKQSLKYLKIHHKQCTQGIY